MKESDGLDTKGFVICYHESPVTNAIYEREDAMDVFAIVPEDESLKDVGIIFWTMDMYLDDEMRRSIDVLV